MKIIKETRRYTVDKGQFEEMFGKRIKQKTLYNTRLYPNVRFIVRKGK